MAVLQRVRRAVGATWAAWLLAQAPPAQAQPSPWALPSPRAQPAPAAYAFRCDDAESGANATSYLIALDAGSLQRSGPMSVSGEAMVLVAARGYPYAYYPVTGPAQIRCRGPITSADGRRRVNIDLSGGDQRPEDVLALLQASPRGRIDPRHMAPNWPPFLRFGPEIGRRGIRPDDLDGLWRAYFREGPRAEFLEGQAAARINVDEYEIRTAPAPGLVLGAAPPPPIPRREAAPAPHTPPAENPGPRRQPPTGARPLPMPAAQSQAAELSDEAGPVASRRIVLRFRNKAAWQGVRLDGPGLVETFGYCRPPAPGPDGLYELLCVNGDGRIPLRIRGFDTLLLDGNEPALDDKLRVTGYSAPYPVSWKRAPAELVSVEGGPLAQVMARRIPLTQGTGLPGCRGEIAGITLGDVIAGTLTFPEPPCLPYLFAVPRSLLSPRLSLASGCHPGTDAPVPIGPQGTVACWMPARQSGDARIEIEVAPGFARIPLSVSRSQAALGQVTVDGQVLSSLAPLWPYAPGILDADEAPAYVPRSVRYVSANGQACGVPARPTPGANGAVALPSLEAAGCTQIPQAMIVTFEQAGSAASGVGIPPEAFRSTFEDTVAIDGAQTGPRRVPIAAARQSLRVGFVPEDAARYAEQFGRAAGNTTFPGIHVFPGPCSGTRNGTFVRFEALGEPRPWPVYAAVYDGRSDEPLTRCARAEIGRDPRSAAPILTFQLEAARAVGPRRAIVISTSPRFLGGGGSAAALAEALKDFAQQLHEAYARKAAPLAPVNVFLVNGSGDYVPLFSGEAAAFEPDKIKQAIQSTRETMAPNTPDFSALDYRPEIKAPGLGRVLFVMDGSEIEPRNVGTLARLINRLGREDTSNVALLVSDGNCDRWQAETATANFMCRALPSGFDGRKAALSEAFARFITPRAPGRDRR